MKSEASVLYRSTPIPRVLVVEDDDNTRLEITAALGDHGFAVDGVSLGHAGLPRALEGAFDAVVLDSMLPDVDSSSSLSTLRNVGKRTPILILSAPSAVDERVRGLRAGGDNDLTKPFDSLELTARLNALLRRRSSPVEPSVPSVDDLILDTNTHHVVRAREVIKLKPRGYLLPKYVMHHSGQPVTRPMLFESAWNYHFNAQSNAIDMHIGQPRRKVSLNGRLSMTIHTGRNVGYILHAGQ